MYYGARYYDPKVGRFMAVDPWEGELMDPQSLNKYAYVANNPLKYVDPSGEFFQLALPALITIATNAARVVVPKVVKKVVQNVLSQATVLPAPAERTTPKLQSPISASLPVSSSEVAALSPPAQSLMPLATTSVSIPEPTWIGDGNKLEDKGWVGGGIISFMENSDFRKLLNDIKNNPDNWEKESERFDEKQPKNGRSIREIWRDGNGNKIEKHILEKNGKPPKNHPHFKPLND